MRLNLVIGDSDETYLESLVCFLIRNYSHRFKISSFSKQQSLENYLEQATEMVDILLISTDLNSSSINKDIINCLFTLTEGYENRGLNSITSINKYQQGDRLAGCIMNLFSENNRGELLGVGTGKKTQVLSVFSPQGGSGKTCIALSACIQCARKGLKAFYLNLEDFNSTSAFFDCHSDCSFSNIIYYLKDKNKNLAMKIEALKCIDSVSGIHYFSPPESDTEVYEMSFNDLKELIDRMISLGTYDYIFLDLPSNFGERNIELLKYSNSIVLTLDWRIGGKVKFNRFMNDFKLFIEKDSNNLKNKLKVVLNRYKQGMEMEFEACDSGVDFIKMPEIINFEWTKILHIGKMDNVYVQAIDQLIQRCAVLY